MTFEKPSLSVLIKVASIVVHADEFLSDGGHTFDIEAMKPLLRDEEVQAWLKLGGVYVPLKR